MISNCVQTSEGDGSVVDTQPSGGPACSPLNLRLPDTQAGSPSGFVVQLLVHEVVTARILAYPGKLSCTGNFPAKKIVLAPDEL